MCRLFGLHAGVHAIDATFWLIEAPDSLSVQSYRNPDGAGIGVFGEDGTATVDKQPLAAWQDREFTSAAHNLSGTTFVAHVRHASIGAHIVANTHPFVEGGRLFAHNGVVQGLSRLESRLAELDATGYVHGETDSQRVFALITAEIGRLGGDVSEGLTVAIDWITENLPVYALNVVLTTSTDLWALRYPATHELYVLVRPAGGTDADRHLDLRGSRLAARSHHLARRPSVVVASERMDNDAGWRLLDPGELLHVNSGLTVTTSAPFRVEPRHLIQRSELDPVAAASQHPDIPGQS